MARTGREIIRLEEMREEDRMESDSGFCPVRGFRIKDAEISNTAP